MAINKPDVEVHVRAVNETSKPLKEARADFERFEDTVKAAASALNEHKGHPRDFANAMKNAFAPLPGVAKSTVDRLSASLEGLEQDFRAVEDAMQFSDTKLGGLRKAKAEIDAERKSVEDRIAAEKMAAKQSADAAKARAAEISSTIKARKADVSEIDKRIAAEQRLHDATEKRLIKNRKTLEEPKVLTAKRQQALEESSVDDANALVNSRNRMAQLVQARAASAALVTPLVQEQQSHKDLTAVAKTEAAKRIAAISAEEDAIKKRDRALETSTKAAMTERAALEARRTAIIQDRTDVSDVRSRALRMQAQLKDPMDVRRVAAGISDGPDREARGLSVLAAESRRAADAQRMLTGETSRGTTAFASMRSELMGLVGVYALYSTSVSQASAVIDAFNTREAFAVGISSTNGGNANEATAQWEYMIGVAKRLKFSISDLAPEYSKLLIAGRGLGMADADIEKIFEGTLSKARATNASNQQIQNAMRALIQVLSKDQAYAEEINGQLAEAVAGARGDFAKAQGYTVDQMAQFSKDMEAGVFKGQSIVKLGAYWIEQNADAVQAAGGTFKAALGDLQNVIFETRLKLAEGGFMDGMKDTVQGFADFLKSEDGQAYMLRMADAANAVVSALVSVAKNLDVVIAGLGVMAGIKIASMVGGAITSIAAASGLAATGMTAMAGSAGTLAAALGVLRAAGGLLLRVLGGIPGLAIAGGVAVANMLSSAQASKIAETNAAMERTSTFIDKIRNAASQARGDLEQFNRLLKEAGVTDKDAMAKSIADVNALMSRSKNAFGWDMMNAESLVRGASAIDDESRKAILEDAKLLRRDLGRLTLDDTNARIEKIADYFGRRAKELRDAYEQADGMTQFFMNASGLMDQAKAFEAQAKAIRGAKDEAAEFYRLNGERVTMTRVSTGQLEEVSDAYAGSGKAASEATVDLKAYNSAMEALKKLGTDTSASKDFADALASIRKNADEAAKAVAGTREEAKKLADIERVVRTAQVTNAAKFLEKRYGDAGLTLRPSAELITLIEGLNNNILSTGANGQVGWVPQNPAGGGSYIANTDGKMTNQNGRLVAQDPALKGLTVSQAALLNAIAAPESGGAYNVRFGGAKGAQTFDLNGIHPNIRERNPANGTYSTAAGRYQFIGSTWRGIMGNAPFTPENQDRAALKNAEQAWARNGPKGVDLYQYLDQNGMDQVVRNALKGQWEGFVGQAGFSKAKATFEASRSRYMSNGVTVGSVTSGGVSVAPDGSIVRAPAAGAAPTMVQDPFTPEQKRALEIVSSSSPALPAKAQDALYEAVLKNLGMADDLGFINTLKDGNLERIADAIEASAGNGSADAFRRETDLLRQAQQVDANAEAFAAVKEIADTLKFSKDDLDSEAARSAAAAREVASAVERLTKDGASLAKAMGTETDDEARAKLGGIVDQRIQVEYGKQLADEAKRRAEEQKQFNEASDKSVRNARQEAELAGVTDEREKARLQARQRIANEQEDAGFTYSEQQIAAREAAEMAKFEAEKNADTAKSKREQAEEDARSLRSSEQRIAIARTLDESAKERLRVENELRDQERERGVTRSDADRNALIEAHMRAFDAENGQAMAEKRHTDALTTLREQLALLESQAAAAMASGDFDERDALRDKISGVRDQIVEATRALEEFYRAMGGPQGEQGAMAMEALRLETQRAKAEFQAMTPEVKLVSDVIEGNLNTGVSTFSKLVAEGRSPLQAFGQAVKQTVGQILVDLGMMITRAWVAKTVMSMLGMSPAGDAGIGTSVAQYLGNMAMPGGKHHDGGIAGDPAHSIDFISGLMNLGANETPAILERGEEVLTAQDPRHRRNLGAGFARFMRLHTGGIGGMEPDSVSSTLAAAGSAGRAMSSSMSKAVADAPAPIINNRNFFDMDSLMNDYMSTPAGQRSVRNVITKDRSKLKAIFS
ncbi:tape measure protein [Paenirhodobacter populi]|uniref:Tape measure protein N-terminal domain-containing protein n=1 Tax=Paenirhodobacter populi TaxID=2306993 RepID=A0A443IZU0_9RHOB|nr:tape measure protein [Sinirhodobacter populi]RWR13825.1 hypothetical protein D2T33_05350 [Sinirhodobacter populi]